MNEEKKNELILEAQQEAREEPYREWKNDNEQMLKEDYMMQFKHEELRDLVYQAEDLAFFEAYEDEYESFCREVFRNEGDI